MANFSIKDFTLGTAKKMLSFIVNTDENIPAKILVDSAGAEVIGVVAANPAANTLQARLKTIGDKDFATQTTLAALLAKVIAAPATEAKQDVAITGLGAIVSALSAATPAGENFVGSVGGKTHVANLTFSLDTNAYAAGDVLADRQAVANALRVNDGTGMLQSLVLIDKDDQGAALDVYVLDQDVAIGIENAAPSITDTNAEAILAIVPVAAADWKDVGGAKVANLSGLARPIKAATGSRNIYVALVNGAGTPTFTASGIVARLGILQD